jgi:hypothetical protein
MAASSQFHDDFCFKLGVLIEVWKEAYRVHHSLACFLLKPSCAVTVVVFRFVNNWDGSVRESNWGAG